MRLKEGACSLGLFEVSNQNWQVGNNLDDVIDLIHDLNSSLCGTIEVINALIWEDILNLFLNNCETALFKGL